MSNSKEEHVVKLCRSYQKRKNKRKNIAPENQENDISGFIPPAFLLQSKTVWRGDWDEAGVYVYQAFNDQIADYAVEFQHFAGPFWLPDRMTWIKPSLGWMLYRSGYASKPNQTRVLRIHLSHETISYLLSHCTLTQAETETRSRKREAPPKKGFFDKGAGNGRVQWDPERDLFTPENGGKKPIRMDERAIQIGLSGPLSRYYASNILSITDVTGLAHQIGAAHSIQDVKACRSAMQALELPDERPYFPCLLPEQKLRELRFLPG